MGAQFKNFKEEDVKNAVPGYTMRALITPLSFLDTEALPVGFANLGDRYTIDDSHTYLQGKGSVVVMCAPDSVEADGEMIGEQLAMRGKYTPKFVLQGDGPAVQELAHMIANGKFLLHIENANCEDGKRQMLQFGDGAEPCMVSKGGFKSGKTSSGSKKYEFECEAYDKYFYNGQLQELQ